ncbi:MAG: ThiF family adenylyltransferase [Sphingomonadales bacterium]
MSDQFDYAGAFDRNIGWITEFEQQVLKGKKIAIAGLGGVGGIHLLSLTRLGIGSFHISDLDRFDLANFNRQIGAHLGSLGKPKTEVLEAMARDINPEISLSTFPDGVHDQNLDAFLNGADLFVDGLDFFELGIRSKIFARCSALAIPAITAAPIGMGVSYLIFMPGHMTFEQYFRLAGLAADRQYVNFALGLTPRAFHRSYLLDPTRLDLAGHRGPSSIAACNLCAGVVAAEAVKILLRRGLVRAAPWCHQFDPYQDKAHSTYLWSGNRNPLQTVKRHIGYRLFARLSRIARPSLEKEGTTEIGKILSFAKWAPSGDNAQPWRFAIRDTDKVDIFLGGREHHNIYEYRDGEPTLMSGGFLLEGIRIAARRFGRSCEWRHTGTGHDGAHEISVWLPKDRPVDPDPLFPYLMLRSVDRRRYRMMRLTDEQKQELEAALGAGLSVSWFETPGQKWRMARINAAATDIRLRLAAAHEVHRKILDWNHAFSATGVPVASLGLDRMTVRLMAWFMTNWARLDFANRFLNATVIPRVEMDLLPGLYCAAHFLITCNTATESGNRETVLLRRGQALHRFWLTATRLGLVAQPSLAPLCFASHAREGQRFSDRVRLTRAADRLAARLDTVSGGREICFLGRVGWPRQPGGTSRSWRKPLTELLQGTS